MTALGSESKRGVPGRKIYATQNTQPRFAGMPLKDKLHAICIDIANRNRDSRMRRNTVHYRMALYYQGYQNIELNADNYTYDVYERDDFFIENQFRRHVDSVVNSNIKNEGELVIRPASQDPKDIAKSRVAGPILDMQKEEIDYESIRMLKNLYKALFGTAFVFVDYIRDQKHGTMVIPKYNYEEIADETGGDPYLSKVPAGFSKVNRGKEIAAVCSPLEIDVRPDVKKFTDIPYLRWANMVDNDVLNYSYPGLGASNSGGSNSIDSDMAHRYMDTLANLPGNALGDSLEYGRTVTDDNKSEFVRTWLTPCTFAGDKELLREFPDGVHVATINGSVVDYYADDLFDHWTSEVLIKLPHSLLGDGLYDALMQQDQINEGNSLFIKNVRFSTVGHNIYDSEMIDPKDIVNDPENGWIRGKGTFEKNISQAVFQVRPQQLSADVSSWISNNKMGMQDMTSVYDSSAGKGIGANTPYSQSVFLNERAQSRWNGSRAYNRGQVVRMHQQLLKFAQNEWLEPRTHAIKANTGEWSFQQFEQADLIGEIDISMSDTDMKPVGRAEQVQALQMYGELMPLFATMTPKQKLRVEEILGMPPDSNPDNAQISRAYRTIDRIEKGEVVTPLAFVDDPNTQVPVFIEVLAGERGESIALADPQTFANIYTFMISLLNMLQGQQGFVMPGMKQGMQPQQGGMPPDQKGTPGGQPGQQGGGPKSEGMEAQSPAPAPPVSPPSA